MGLPPFRPTALPPGEVCAAGCLRRPRNSHRPIGVIQSPAVANTPGRYGTCEIGSGAYRRDWLVDLGRDWGIRTRGRTVTELTELVKSPAVHFSVAGYSAAVVGAGTHRLKRERSGYGNWSPAARCGSVAELARSVPAPAVDSSTGSDSAGVRMTGAY